MTKAMPLLLCVCLQPIPAAWILALAQTPAAPSELEARCRFAKERAHHAPFAPETRAAWEAVLALDPEHAAARRALSHHRYDGVWFNSFAEADARRREDEHERLTTRGDVRLGARWVPWTDAPFLRLGWARGADGAWQQPPPMSLPNSVGWRREHVRGFELFTTLPAQHAPEYDTALARVAGDLRRIVGDVPQLGRDVPLTILASLAEYNMHAAGDPSQRRGPTELSGGSACHYAYFADAWFEPTRPLRTFRGMGVASWDTADPALAPFGPFAARHAAARSWMDTVDPSPGTMADAVLEGRGGLDLAAYWAEKRLPRWLHVGAAMYTERFFLDRSPGAADPAWARTWALTNLRAEVDLERALACVLDGRRPEESSTTMQLAGLVVAFVVDGGAARVETAHRALVAALAAASAPLDPAAKWRLDAGVRAAARELEDSLRSEEGALRAFAR